MMKRYNHNKPELSHILEFERAMFYFARQCQVGAKKYGRGNWKEGGREQVEFIDSALRHLQALMSGEDIYQEKDKNGHVFPEFLHHAAAVMWNMAAYMELELKEELQATETGYQAIKAHHDLVKQHNLQNVSGGWYNRVREELQKED